MCGTPKGLCPLAAQSQPARLATPPPPSESKNNNNNSSNIVTTASEPCEIPNKVEIIRETKDIQQSDVTAKNMENINEMNKSRSNEPQVQEQQLISQRNVSETKENSSGIATNVSTNLSPGAVSHRAGEGAMALNNYETERLLRQLRRRLREADWAWLNACNGVVEGNYEPVEAYLSAGKQMTDFVCVYLLVFSFICMSFIAKPWITSVLVKTILFR